MTANTSLCLIRFSKKGNSIKFLRKQQESVSFPEITTDKMNFFFHEDGEVKLMRWCEPHTGEKQLNVYVNWIFERVVLFKEKKLAGQQGKVTKITNKKSFSEKKKKINQSLIFPKIYIARWPTGELFRWIVGTYSRVKGDPGNFSRKRASGIFFLGRNARICGEFFAKKGEVSNPWIQRIKNCFG